MDYNQLAKDIIAELKTNARRTDAEIATRLGISRQAYVRRRDNNDLTTEDITVLSAWLVTAFGGGFYLDKHLLATSIPIRRGSYMDCGKTKTECYQKGRCIGHQLPDNPFPANSGAVI